MAANFIVYSRPIFGRGQTNLDRITALESVSISLDAFGAKFQTTFVVCFKKKKKKAVDYKEICT